MRFYWVPVCLFLFLIAGCDSARFEKLENENADLKARVEKQNASIEYDLQAKCAKDARAWFLENWGTGSGKGDILLHHTNHYNKKSNSCMTMVEYHYNTGIGASWHNDISLWNVYENSQYGTFSEQHDASIGDSFKQNDKVYECVVMGNKCSSLNEFNNLSRQYMND